MADAALSKSEQKRRAKQAQKEAEKAEKDAAKKAAGGDKPKAKKDDGPQLEDDEDIDPTKYFDNRLTWVNQRKTSGPDPYPHKFNVQLQLPDYHAKYASIADGEFSADEGVSIAGVAAPLSAQPTQRRRKPAALHAQGGSATSARAARAWSFTTCSARASRCRSSPTRRSSPSSPPWRRIRCDDARRSHAWRGLVGLTPAGLAPMGLTPTAAAVAAGGGRFHGAGQHDQARRRDRRGGPAGQDQARRALDLPQLDAAAHAVPAHDAQDHLRCAP